MQKQPLNYRLTQKDLQAFSANMPEAALDIIQWTLICTPAGTMRCQWSFFKEGLQWFHDYVKRYNICLKPCFVPDKRLC